jgi:NAD(P)-dependent dehydrogenase (short-subunit alcohol dehydrogenase family)
LDCNDKLLRSIENALPSLSGTINTDVSDPDGVARGFDELDELLDRIDVLINNAGISVRQNFMDITPQQ